MDALVAAQTGGGPGPLLDLVADAVRASLRDTLAACLGSQAAEARSPELVVAVRRWLAE